MFLGKAQAWVFLVCLVCLTTLALTEEEVLCKEAKKKGYKVICPDWSSPSCDTCSWVLTGKCDDLTWGTCGAGIKKFIRSRDCTFLNDTSNLNEHCTEDQERREKCELQCGSNGIFNELLGKCDCTDNWNGICCDKRVEACTNPVIKKGEADRSIAHQGKGNRCDATLRPRWYRFESPVGNLMPVHCVPQWSCNTAVPFWLNGSHPTEDEGLVDRIACGTEGDNCCKHKLEIKVRNCGSFMSYYLVPTQGCMKSYCIGSHEKCPPGQSSDTGYQPNCTSIFPDIEVEPKVGYHVKEGTTTNDVFLTCTASHPQAANYLWKAQWFFNDEAGDTQEQNKSENNPQPVFHLPSELWKSKMGTYAQCLMVAKHKDGLGTWSQPVKKSHKYYLGIVVQESKVDVREGETANVTLRPNLPVRCNTSYENRHQCHLVMHLSMDPTPSGPTCPGKPIEISQVIFEGNMNFRCGYKGVNHTNWNKPNKLRIKPKLDIQIDGTQTRVLRMRIDNEDTSVPDFWHGYILPSVKLNIRDADDRSTCSVFTDPHIKTFDERKYLFHDRKDQKGDKNIFVLYRHTTELEEVQARFSFCVGGFHYYCICGVAIRAGSSTIVFDKCRTNPALTPEFNFNVTNPSIDRRMKVFQHNNGKTYNVFLPTGTQVQVSHEPYRMILVDIKASVEAKGKSVGLCGNNNGNPSDDIKTSHDQIVCQEMDPKLGCQDESFRISWLVPEQDSIFAGKVPPHKPDEHNGLLYCDCVSEPGHHGYEDCDYHKRYEPCDDGKEVTPSKSTNKYSQEEFPWLSSYKTPEHQNPGYVKAVAAMEDHYYNSWASESWTDDKAREYCNGVLFSSPAVTTCLKEVPNQDYTTNIEACMQDLVLTGSKEFALTHLEHIKSICKQELKMNIELWEPREEEKDDDGDDGGDKEEEPPTNVRGPPLRLTENLCPNECSGNGACIDSKCICKKGFSSYDCSMKVDEVPVVKGVASSSLPCDRSSQDCSAIALEGIKYLEGPNLTCHYFKDDGDDEQFFYSGKSPSIQLSANPGKMFSLWIVQCDVPSKLSEPASLQTTFYKLQVSVSNNGITQSDRAYYASYDSKCETCVNKTCKRKTDACIISSQCYVLGDFNPMNPNEVCNPTINGYTWSPAPSTTSPTEPPTTSTTRAEDGDDIVCNGGMDEVSIHRDPKNCNKYYVCEGKRKHHMPCPNNLAFSEKRGTCIEPHLVPGCIEGTKY